jgi:hypothetical protein
VLGAAATPLLNALAIPANEFHTAQFKQKDDQVGAREA